MNYFVYTLPIIAALIGWFTNFLAVKMLFHPKEPLNLWLFELQGIFPKRQKMLAEKLGKIVAEELISFDEIRAKLEKPDNFVSIMNLIEERLDHFLNEGLQETAPFLASFMSERKKNKIKQKAMEEVKEAVPLAVSDYIGKAEKELDVEKMVYEKVVAFSTDKLEDILFSILQKEFRFIEIIGAVLGFFIGLIQLLLMRI